MNLDQKAVLAGVVFGLGLLGGVIASATYYLGNQISEWIPWADLPGILVQIAGSSIFHLVAVGFVSSLSVLLILYVHAVYTS
ncbi:hypothetical protein [Methanonatronarchaeum thermophilum]|uniref:hypothetical protein n=1 Tax=Methanonatronarchaeum thermophilum TaxID=1927129 RepID=UPI000A3B2897|nr:hypothetical protein [Methanonatronarchaeum thermophilum]